MSGTGPESTTVVGHPRPLLLVDSLLAFNHGEKIFSFIKWADNEKGFELAVSAPELALADSYKKRFESPPAKNRKNNKKQNAKKQNDKKQNDNKQNDNKQNDKRLRVGYANIWPKMVFRYLVDGNGTQPVRGYLGSINNTCYHAQPRAFRHYLSLSLDRFDDDESPADVSEKKLRADARVRALDIVKVVEYAVADRRRIVVAIENKYLLEYVTQWCHPSAQVIPHPMNVGRYTDLDRLWRWWRNQLRAHLDNYYNTESVRERQHKFSTTPQSPVLHSEEQIINDNDAWSLAVVLDTNLIPPNTHDHTLLSGAHDNSPEVTGELPSLKLVLLPSVHAEAVKYNSTARVIEDLQNQLRDTLCTDDGYEYARFNVTIEEPSDTKGDTSILFELVKFIQRKGHNSTICFATEDAMVAARALLICRSFDDDDELDTPHVLWISNPKGKNNMGSAYWKYPITGQENQRQAANSWIRHVHGMVTTLPPDAPATERVVYPSRPAVDLGDDDDDDSDDSDDDEADTSTIIHQAPSKTPSNGGSTLNGNATPFSPAPKNVEQPTAPTRLAPASEGAQPTDKYVPPHKRERRGSVGEPAVVMEVKTSIAPSLMVAKFVSRLKIAAGVQVRQNKKRGTGGTTTPVTPQGS